MPSSWGRGLNEMMPKNEKLSYCCSCCISHFFFSRATRRAGSWFPDQEMNPCPAAVEAQSPNHWTAREVPVLVLIADGWGRAPAISTALLG